MKNVIRLILTISIFLIFGRYNAYAQLDTTYIKVHKNKVSLGARLGALNNNFIIANDSLKYNLNSNIVPIVSLWFKYKKLPTIIIGIPITSIGPDSLAKTKGVSINLNGQMAKGFIINGYIFYEKGFNFQDRTDRKNIRPMRETYNLNLNLELFYIFNFKKMSYKNAYLFGETQLKSKGSFTVGLSTGYFRLHNKSPFFKDFNTISNTLNIANVSGLNVSLSGGYFYTFVFGKSKKWFLNGAFSIGPSFNYGTTTYFSNLDNSKILHLGLYTKYKFALGYKLPKWDFVLTSHGDFISIRPSKDAFINSNVIDVKISTIYKF